MRGRPRAAWTIFGLYAGALFIGTHWPRLAIESPVIGTDKIIHAAVFCAWTVLLCRAVCATSARVSIARVGLIAIAYACFDEGLQAIPALGRTCSILDLSANIAGIGLGLLPFAIRHRAGRGAAPIEGAPAA